MTDETTDTKPPEYDDELTAAVRAAQLRICTQEVPEALTVRLERAQAARDAGVREWWTAGNREVREIEAPFLRVAPAMEEPETSGPESGKKKPGARRRRSAK